MLRCSSAGAPGSVCLPGAASHTPRACFSRFVGGYVHSSRKASLLGGQDRLVMLISSTSPAPSLRAHYSATAAPAVAKPAAATTKEQEELLEMDIHTFDQRASAPFRLSSKFVSKFKDKQPPFGFNGLGGTMIHSIRTI